MTVLVSGGYIQALGDQDNDRHGDGRFGDPVADERDEEGEEDDHDREGTLHEAGDEALGSGSEGKRVSW